MRSGAKSARSVSMADTFVLDARLRFDRVDVVDAKRQHVFVVDGINDGVGYATYRQRPAPRGTPQRVAGGAGVLGKDRRAGEAEQVALEHPGDFGVHIAELGCGGTPSKITTTCASYTGCLFLATKWRASEWS